MGAMTEAKKTGAGRIPAGMPGQAAASHDPIMQRLRDFYDSVQDEGTPDRFLDLLDRLDEAETKASENPE